MKTKIKFFLLGLLTSGALASPLIIAYHHQHQVIQSQLQHLEDSIMNTDSYMMDELDYIYTELELLLCKSKCHNNKINFYRILILHKFFTIVL